MSIELWLAFVLAATILLLIPGPTVLLVLSYALNRGRGSALMLVGGVIAGDAVAISLSLMGVGALLMASATVFNLLKWAGAIYLVWLGIKMLRAGPTVAAGAKAGSDGAMAFHAFAVTVTNPKTLAFFIAFLPQFVDPTAPAGPQMVILGVTFVTLAFITNMSYALLAGTFSSRLKAPTTQVLLNRIGGGLLISAGVLTAAIRRV